MKDKWNEGQIKWSTNEMKIEWNEGQMKLRTN